jgi:dATP pyrophosphohydrolase
LSEYKRPESVLVVVYTRAGKVLLLKRADMPEFWQSVTGAMRWDEADPRATAVRELEEETGLRVAPTALRDLAPVQRFAILPEFRQRYAPGTIENIEHAFACELEAEAPIRLSEHTEYGWFDFDAAQQKVWSWTNRNAIGDARRRFGAPAREVVVLVHGWLMSGAWMAMLAWRLRRAGFVVRTFSYATRESLHANAARLHTFLQSISAGTVHLVGHSLGGLVIRALLHHFPATRPGRVVTLGSPHQGSAAAQQLARGRLGRALLGKSVLEVVAGVPHAWSTPTCEVGTISGTVPIGIGRWMLALPTPHDGTLTCEETSFAGARAQRQLPVTHTGMLTSRAVAQAVTRFLREGDFG